MAQLGVRREGTWWRSVSAGGGARSEQATGDQICEILAGDLGSPEIMDGAYAKYLAAHETGKLRAPVISQSAAWRGGNGACGTRARAAPKTAICQYVAIRGDAWRCVALGGVAERCVAHIPLVPLEPRGRQTSILDTFGLNLPWPTRYSAASVHRHVY